MSKFNLHCKHFSGGSTKVTLQRGGHREKEELDKSRVKEAEKRKGECLSQTFTEVERSKHQPENSKRRENGGKGDGVGSKGAHTLLKTFKSPIYSHHVPSNQGASSSPTNLNSTTPITFQPDHPPPPDKKGGKGVQGANSTLRSPSAKLTGGKSGGKWARFLGKYADTVASNKKLVYITIYYI